jgi:hypothetical protein
LELQRKAPGLQDGILQPTRDVKSKVTSQKVEEPSKIDLREFYTTSKQNQIEGQDDLTKFFSQTNPYQSNQATGNQKWPNSGYTLAISPTLSKNQSQIQDQKPKSPTKYIQQKMKSPVKQSPTMFSYSSPSAQVATDQFNKYTQMGFSNQSITTAIDLYPTENAQLEFLYTIKELTDKGFELEVSHIAFGEFGTNMVEIMWFMEKVRIISDMGFDLSECAKALVNAKHDKDLALNMLLD